MLKDRAYFGAESGVTASGGEALTQENTLECTDLVLYDVKLADSARHKKWRTAGNEMILKNLQIVADWASQGRGA